MTNSEVQEAINAIRQIKFVLPEDVAAICAALSCQVAKDPNKHIKPLTVSVDSLDDLANYLNDEVADRALVDSLMAAEDAAVMRRHGNGVAL